MTLEKLKLFEIAATLTNAACAARGLPALIGGAAGMPIDPTLADNNQRGINLEVWEIFRSYYAAVVQAYEDEKSWTSPPAAAGSPGSNAGAIIQAVSQPAIAALIQSNPVLAPLAVALQGLINLPAPATPATPLPAPGSAGTATTVPTAAK